MYKPLVYMYHSKFSVSAEKHNWFFSIKQQLKFEPQYLLIKVCFCTLLHILEHIKTCQFFPVHVGHHAFLDVLFNMHVCTSRYLCDSN